jgi:hypothetical protein
MQISSPEVGFSQIEREFKETFGYIRGDIAAIGKTDLRLNYTVALLICCACQMLAWHKGLADDQVFTSLLPDGEPYRVIGKTMFEALRNGLAHRFRPDTIEIGEDQWRFTMSPDLNHLTASQGRPNWLRVNVKILSERVASQIEAYERELRESPRARLEFLERSKRCLRHVPREQAPQVAAAWRSLL